ncbi:MAG: hypothetical protein LBN05_01525 [Oscillospiraceae bacterium]|jgi:hypothetical protein|nr:hypothetical protein [Oscillospiraceae bacterium]
MSKPKNRAKKSPVLAAITLGLLIGLLLVLVFLGTNKVQTELTIEAGEPLPAASDFLSLSLRRADFLTPLPEPGQLGDFPLEVSVGQKTYAVTLHVRDTVPPTATPVDKSVFTGATVTPEDFVKDLRDGSAVKLSFAKKPSTAKPGEFTLEIFLTDAAKNKTTLNATLTVEKDTEPPVIEGAKDLTIPLGGNASYRSGVSVTDNSGEKIELNINSAAANLDEPGAYPIIYTAKDPSGNSAKETITLTVNAATEEQLDALVEPLLAKIITDDMSDKQKARAVYDWVTKNIYYRVPARKISVLDGAYTAMTKHAGDCYTFFAISKYMLDKVGVENVAMKKTDEAIAATNERHYWILINVGDGWYHFDTTLWKKGPEQFMMTESFVEKLTKQRGKMNYVYDHDAVPEAVQE